MTMRTNSPELNSEAAIYAEGTMYSGAELANAYNAYADREDAPDDFQRWVEAYLPRPSTNHIGDPSAYVVVLGMGGRYITVHCSRMSDGKWLPCGTGAEIRSDAPAYATRQEADDVADAMNAAHGYGVAK